MAAQSIGIKVGLERSGYGDGDAGCVWLLTQLGEPVDMAERARGGECLK